MLLAPFVLLAFITHEEQRNSTRASMGTNNRSNVVNKDLALKSWELLFDHVAHIFGIGAAVAL